MFSSCLRLAPRLVRCIRHDCPLRQVYGWYPDLIIAQLVAENSNRRQTMYLEIVRGAPFVAFNVESGERLCELRGRVRD